jgi:hypothetical protein
MDLPLTPDITLSMEIGIARQGGEIEKEGSDLVLILVYEEEMN